MDSIKKWAYTGVVIFVLLAAFVQSTAIAADSLKKTIFLHYWTGALQGGIDDMVRTFNQRNPQYPIKATGFEHESFKVSIKVMLAGGNPPDLFSYWAGARVQALVDAGYLAPIDDLWEQNKLNEHFTPALMKASTYNGNKYIIPVTQHYAAFFYNKEIFDKNKIEIPRIWEDFLKICQQLQSVGITPIALGSKERWPAQFWFDYILLRTAGPSYRQKLMSGQAAYTDAEVKKAYSLWKQLLDQGYFNASPNLYNWSDASKMVFSGEAAMTLMGTWIIGLLDGQMGWLQGIGYDFFSFPVIDPLVPGVAVGPVDAIVLPREANHFEAAKTALIYFSEDTPQQEMSKGSGALAPNQTISPSFYTPLQQRILQTIKNTPHWAFNYDLATPPPVAEVGLNSFSKFLEHPEQYLDILKDTEKKAKVAFSAH
ncbi:MAG: extracellular solute-binding protein [SAR324 cluster bacterium]|nr:extracellular solute-binding protein [SAR324 cluster bacterium]